MVGPSASFVHECRGMSATTCEYNWVGAAARRRPCCSVNTAQIECYCVDLNIAIAWTCFSECFAVVAAQGVDTISNCENTLHECQGFLWCLNIKAFGTFLQQFLTSIWNPPESNLLNAIICNARKTAIKAECISDDGGNNSRILKKLGVTFSLRTVTVYFSLQWILHVYWQACLVDKT